MVLLENHLEGLQHDGCGRILQTVNGAVMGREALNMEFSGLRKSLWHGQGIIPSDRPLFSADHVTTVATRRSRLHGTLIQSGIISQCGGATESRAVSRSSPNTLKFSPMTTTGRHATTSPVLSPSPSSASHPKEPRRDRSLVRWGRILSWAKEASGSAGMINARSESAAIDSRRPRPDAGHLLSGQLRPVARSWIY